MPPTHALFIGQINLPKLSKVGHRTLPFVFVANEAFPLKQFLMKPYPARELDEQRRIYNYRLSRARRVIENAFGKPSQCESKL